MNRFFSGALLGFCFVLSLLTVTTASAQLSTADYVTESDYRIYHRDGTPATLDDIREALPAVDVVFVGELHNDPVSHFIEQRVPQQLQADLDRLAAEGIPVDIVFEQGLAAVGR
jgi:uncharacterized iron-regulated protein